MGLPSRIRAGDTVRFTIPAGVDDLGAAIESSTWAAVAFFRFNKAAEGVTVNGTAQDGGGWLFEISATTSATMDAGEWFGQVRATLGAAAATLAAQRVEVLPSLSYTGTPAAFDGRSAAAVELAEVQTAIRALVSRGAQAYTIGSRSYTALDLGRLTARESQLKAIVARERAAERVAAGLGDSRDLFVRF